MAAGDFRDRLLKGLGGPWPEPTPLKPKHLETIEQDTSRDRYMTSSAALDYRIIDEVLVKREDN